MRLQGEKLLSGTINTVEFILRQSWLHLQALDGCEVSNIKILKLNWLFGRANSNMSGFQQDELERDFCSLKYIPWCVMVLSGIHPTHPSHVLAQTSFTWFWPEIWFGGFFFNFILSLSFEVLLILFKIWARCWIWRYNTCSASWECWRKRKSTWFFIHYTEGIFLNFFYSFLIVFSNVYSLLVFPLWW